MAAGAVEPLMRGIGALGHETAGVLTMRNRRRPQAVLDLVAAAAGVEVDVVESKERLAPLLRSYEPDVALCSGFGWRIPPDALAVPRLGCVNGHPSLLPRWRGPNPFGWTLRAGDPEVGFTFHRMDEDFDTGPILSQGSMPLRGDETMPGLFDYLPTLVPPLLAEALERVERGERGDPQDDTQATYAPLFEDEFAELDWTKTAREVHDQARCWFLPTVSGIMGPLTTLDGERVRVLETSLDLEGDGVLLDCADRPLRVVRTEPV